MLPRSQRLSAEQLVKAIKDGRVLHSPFFTIRYLAISGNTKIAASVPTKVSKKAVQRNKFRRKMYEAIKTFKKDLKPDFEIVIFLKSPGLIATQEEFRTDMRTLFVKSGLLS